MNNVEYIEIEKLKPFEKHPYKVDDNKEMENSIESIKENGILTPIIVRPIENNENTYKNLLEFVCVFCFRKKFKEAVIKKGFLTKKIFRRSIF